MNTETDHCQSAEKPYELFRRRFYFLVGAS